MSSRPKGELECLSNWGRSKKMLRICQLTKKYYGNSDEDHKHMMIAKERYKTWDSVRPSVPGFREAGANPRVNPIENLMFGILTPSDFLLQLPPNSLP